MSNKQINKPPQRVGPDSSLGRENVTPSEGLASLGLSPTDHQIGSNSSSMDGSGTGLKVKSQLTKETQEQASKTAYFNAKEDNLNSKDKSIGPLKTVKDQSEKNKPSPFSPNSNSATSNFFSGKGPIKPQAMIPVQNMIIPSQQQMMGGMSGRFGIVQTFGKNTEEYYGEEGEEGEYGDEDLEGYEMYQDQQQKIGGKILSLEQEKVILKELSISAQRNPEFIKVLNILANDPELRPLIFEHESLLKALKDMLELKAEQMLSILTAAETEMFMTSQKQDQSQQLEKTQTFNRSSDLKNAEVEANFNSIEIGQLKDKIFNLEKENEQLNQKLQASNNQINNIGTKSQSCTKCSTYKSQVSELRNELQVSIKEKETLKEQIVRDFKQHSEKIDEIRLQNERLQNERDELKARDSNELQTKQKEKVLKEENGDLKRAKKKLEAQVKQLKDEFNTLELKLNDANSKIVESEQMVSRLDFENQQLHVKVAQAKSSIQIGCGRSSVEDNTETLMKRPESSKLRVRISNDDSSEQPQAELKSVERLFEKRRSDTSSFLLDEKLHKQKRSQSSLTKMGQAINFDDMDSIDQDLSIHVDDKKQIEKLQEENNELKARVRQMAKNKGQKFDGQKSQSPLATFSPLKEAVSEAQIYIQPSLTETKDPTSHKLNEVGSRLQNLMMKLGCNVERYRNTDYGLQLIKDMIYDIQIQCEDIMTSQTQQDSYRLFHPQVNKRMPYQQSRAPAMHFASGDHSDTTMDITNFRANSGDRAQETALKSQLLEEKDKRLTIQESLLKTREEQFQYKEQIEQLKHELRKRPQLSTQDCKVVTQREINQFQEQVDSLQDENITMKLKVADLEQELIDERFKKKINYDVSIDSIKVQVQQQVIDFKVKQEEKLIKEKEENLKLRVSLQGLEERITVLKDQLNAFRYRILELEKENIQATKENYILNTELDYESIKNTQIQKRTDQMHIKLQAKNLIERSQLDKAVFEYESQIAKLQEKVTADPNPFQKFTVEKLEHEVQQLKTENSNLQKIKAQNQVQIQKYMDLQIDMQIQIEQQTEQLKELHEISSSRYENKEKIERLEREVAKVQRLEQELAIFQQSYKPKDSFTSQKNDQDLSKIDVLKKENEALKEKNYKLEQHLEELKAEYQMELTLVQNNLTREQQQLKNEKTNALNTKLQVQQLQHQLKETEQQKEASDSQIHKARNLLIKSIVKRNGQFSKLNAFYQLKLLVSETSIYSEGREMLHEKVYSLQNQNQMLCKQIGKIVRSVCQQKPLKLQLSSLISKQGLDFILAGLKNAQDVISELNLNDNEFDDDDLFKICDRLQADVNISRLKLKQNNFQEPDPLIALIGQCGSNFTHLDFSKTVFNNSTLPKLCESLKQLSRIEELSVCQILGDLSEIAINYFSTTLIKLRTLKCLDLSKNKFEPSQLNHLLQLLPQLVNLHTLSVSQINLSDSSVSNFCKMLEKQYNLKKLNLSGNLALSSNGLIQILQKLKQTALIQELDLSKLNFDENHACYRELADMILQNRKLISLSLQQEEMSDQTAAFLIEPLVRSLNIESLKLDENKISGQWLEKYCKRMALVGFGMNIQSGYNGLKQNTSLSVLATESCEDSSRLSIKSPINSQINGLINLSLEGNEEIGDRGAEAIAMMIQTKSDATKNMKMINLNQCGISNYGFHKLKQSLVTRGSMTKEFNLTHIGIKVERNLFDQ